MVIANATVAVLVAAVFVLLYGAVTRLDDATRSAQNQATVLRSANQLEQLLISLEGGQRGYMITGNDVFLRSWKTNIAAYPGQVRDFQHRADMAGGAQRRQGDRLADAADAYVWDYSVPLVTGLERRPGKKQPSRVTLEGKRRIDALRSQFDGFFAAQHRIATEQKSGYLPASRRATIAASGVAALSLALIFGLAFLLARMVVRPLRRAADTAGRLAAGDTDVRMPENGRWEIGVLQRSFNTMVACLRIQRDQLRRVADEQAALRRVAILVAQEAPPRQVFETVAGELGRLVSAGHVVIGRFESDRTETVVGAWRRDGSPDPPPVGSRLTLRSDGLEAVVHSTGRPYLTGPGEPGTGGLCDWALKRGAEAGAGSPVMVCGRVWGTIVALWCRPAVPATGTEQRMLEFTGLVGTALANAESRSALAAARTRLVAAADDTRRRIERDLHDGVQQRLVSLGLEMHLAESALPQGDEDLVKRFGTLAQGLRDVQEEVREISRGLHPVTLARAGLGPALRSLAHRSPLPLEFDIDAPRLPEQLEVAIYYIICEAVTNAVKHAHATVLRAAVQADGSAIRLSIRDDGIGGAEIGTGSGLIGIKDRVDALGGTFEIESPAGAGTTVRVRLPRRTA